MLAARALADMVIVPEIRTSSQLGLGSRGWLIEAGEKAAQSRVVKIRRLFAESRSLGREQSDAMEINVDRRIFFKQSFQPA